MTTTALLGVQWGDEGKGKITDLLAAQVDHVVRCTGGANAGHTIVVDGQTYKLHHLPSGILRPGVTSVIGHGVVIDADKLQEELDALPQTRGALRVSDRAHLVLPTHKILDRQREEARGSGKIGTTGKGIGPCYASKAIREGIRVGDLFDKEGLAGRIEQHLAIHPSLGDPGDRVAELRAYLDRAKSILEPYVEDTIGLLLDAHESGARILLEGAQGALLDLDTGSYPFVTSSSPGSAGALQGCGLPPNALKRVIGVCKAYATRVGSGPFPTELADEAGDTIRSRGHEFGTTTGRPRRCGWLDLVALRYAVRINGVTELALTKLDVLNGLDAISVCTGYRQGGGEITMSLPRDHGSVSPVYTAVDPWPDFGPKDPLPPQITSFVSQVEEFVGVPVSMLGVGPARNEIVHLRN